MTRAVALLLGPVILPQANALRRRTPELTDPPGERSGGAGDALVRVVGDSTAVGMGVETLEEALPARLAARLGSRWAVAGRSGWTAAQVRADYGADAAEPADVLVLLVGWNDAMQLRSRAAFGRDLEALLADAHAGRIVVVGAPDFGRYAVLPQPLRTALGTVAAGIADRARRVAGAHGAVFVPGFDGAHVARDGFHPDAAGYDALAAAIAAALS